LLDRGVEFAVAVVAVVKAGAGYVVLDPEFPDERLRGIAADAGLRALITDTAHHTRALGGPWPEVLVDAEREVIAGHESSDLPVVLGGEDVACVMFTSGSTGRPKGILSTHRNL
ncbi:AMP-binding protein, partial [Streptomyces sp. DH24]|uniref:AMP-binding protein n=1 Tax=Streptomyces sp. DH24 TaxID=3040123 RepID=UPI0024423B0D